MVNFYGFSTSVYGIHSIIISKGLLILKNTPIFLNHQSKGVTFTYLIIFLIEIALGITYLNYESFGADCGAQSGRFRIICIKNSRF